jgi:hypothetical protein
MSTKVYRIVSLADAEQLDFNLLEDASLNEARKSLDGSEVVVQYKEQPSTVDSSFYDLASAQQKMLEADWFLEEDVV